MGEQENPPALVPAVTQVFQRLLEGTGLGREQSPGTHCRALVRLFPHPGLSLLICQGGQEAVWAPSGSNTLTSVA